MRKCINLNDGWRFNQKNDQQSYNIDYDDNEWVSVQIPHTWNAVDGANGFEYDQGAYWYRREFIIDIAEQDNRVYIEFNGSNSITNVYVNEKHVGEHRGGYSTFRFDITDVVNFGESNLLAVQVDNTVTDDVYPQMADFTFYGGIYRDVNLIITNQVHFDLLDDGSKGVYITQNEVTNDKANITVQSLVSNKANEERKVRVWLDILDEAGEVVTYGTDEVFLKPKETRAVDIPIKVKQPTLWNGKQSPYMYNAVATLQSFNDTIDDLRIPFGLRYFHVDKERGFSLNGKHLRLNGVSRHQDRKDKGWAISKEDQLEDMELIKEIGATSVRLAHYQHDNFFYDLCDQEGLVVWAEIPFISIMSKTELEGINPKQQMRELIKQNYNHPSIIFWGIQNEIQIGGDRPEVRKVVKELNELTKSLDSTRLTTMANVMFVKDDDEYNYITDVVGYNKYYGWYQGQAEEFGTWLDEIEQNGLDFPLAISEYGAEGIVQYHSTTPEVRDYTEEYHALYHEKVWKIFENRPFLWATYVWNMFDFGANIRDEGGVKGRNNKGLVTYDRMVKKDAFFMYKAHWSDEKFVHIAGKRFVDHADESVNVKIYTNCNDISLYIDGQLHQTFSGDNRIIEFDDIKLSDTWTEIKAIGSDGKEEYKDVAKFQKVAESNPSYLAPENEGGPVDNWFKLPDLGDVEIEEIEITDDVYSTKDNFKTLYSNSETKAIIEKYLPDVEDSEMFNFLEGMNAEDMKGLAPNMFNDKLLFVLNKQLTKIKKS